MVLTADDERWMRRALRQGVRSLGRTCPNPGVGCCIVRDGVVLGEGRHELDGGPHAEINALSAVRDAGYDPAGATVYVTLAPCTTAGRTGACSQALIDAGVARVVAAVADPVQDAAPPIFAQAGITYDTGCLQALAEHLHGGFLCRVQRRRPRLTGKWAMTLDGSLAAAGGHSAWISSAEARALSRRRRRVYDAIVVGGGTARTDDPELLSTSCDGRSPTRVVISSRADLPPQGRLLADQSVPVLLIHDGRASTAAVAALEELGVGTAKVLDARDPYEVADALGTAGFNDVLVEGGSRIHHAFLEADLYDRLECYLGAKTLGGGMPVAVGLGKVRVPDGDQWGLECPPQVLGSSVLTRWRRSVPT